MEGEKKEESSGSRNMDIKKARSGKWKKEERN